MAIIINANLKDLSGSADAGWAIFRLVDFGSEVPRISGAVLSLLSVKAVANGSGAISQSIIGNDTVTPAGTSYVVDIYSDNGSLIASQKYQFTGAGPIDLSSI